MTSGGIVIDTLRCDYVVSSEHPAPEAVRVRLDDIAATTLPGVLGRMLEEPAADGIWLIRRIEVDLAIDAAGERDAVGRRWAGCIARAVFDEIAGIPGDNLVRFADTTDLLRHFVVDLARGVAWQKWCYASFAGLRPLSTSAAIRSAVVSRAEGLDALAAMSDA